MPRSLKTALVLLLGLGCCAPLAAADVPMELAVIAKVGKEGAGNTEAAAAWKKLASRGPEALTAILAALNDEQPLVGNWLRTAVDAIAERTLAAGQPLPAEELEKFVVDRRNSRGGRRLAYDWLVRVQPEAAARLLPTMLDDPSGELRRDAVADQIKKAEQLAKTDKEAAKAAYRKALAAACDKDQVDALAKTLKDLGETVDLAAHFGMLRKWHLCGMFDNTNGVGFAAVYPPEKGVDLKAVYKGKGGEEVRWAEHGTDDAYGLVDLNKLLGKKKEVVAYAYTVIDSPTEQLVQIRVGSITAVKVFINGQEVLAKEEYHHGMRMDQYIAAGKLRAGRNELLVKVCQNNQTESWAQNWQFQIRLTDPAGATVPWTQVALQARD